MSPLCMFVLDQTTLALCCRKSICWFEMKPSSWKVERSWAVMNTELSRVSTGGSGEAAHLPPRVSGREERVPVCRHRGAGERWVTALPCHPRTGSPCCHHDRRDRRQVRPGRDRACRSVPQGCTRPTKELGPGEAAPLRSRGAGLFLQSTALDPPCELDLLEEADGRRRKYQEREGTCVWLGCVPQAVSAELCPFAGGRALRHPLMSQSRFCM